MEWSFNTRGSDDLPRPVRPSWLYYFPCLLWAAVLAAVYWVLVPRAHLVDDEHMRALALAFLFGGVVGVTEIASRYRDEQGKAVVSPDGVIYLLFNGAISTFALILIFHLQRHNQFTSLQDPLVAAMVAGFGASAVMRTRLAVIKGSDNKEISIGPDIVINLLLSLIDRRIDRWRALVRQRIVADHLGTLKALGTVEQTTQYLFAALLAFQNLSEAEKQQFIDTIKANK